MSLHEREGIVSASRARMADAIMERDAFGSEEFRIFYLRNSSLVLCTMLVLGCGVQLWLSHRLAPLGKKSQTINSVFVFYLGVALYNLQVASSSEKLSRYTYVGVPSTVVFCLTRVIRIISLARGSGAESVAWLSVGHGESGLMIRSFSQVLSGLVLTMTMADLAPLTRSTLVAAPEVLRLTLLTLAVARAGTTRRIVACAAKQAAVCGIAYLAGILLAATHERAVRGMWQRVQSLEMRCAFPESTFLDQHCLLAMYNRF